MTDCGTNGYNSYGDVGEQACKLGTGLIRLPAGEWNGFVVGIANGYLTKVQLTIETDGHPMVGYDQWMVVPMKPWLKLMVD